MRHDETRDNTTKIENQSIEADAHADTREGDDTRCMESRVADAWWEGFKSGIRRSKPFMDDTPEPEGMPEDHVLSDPEHDPIGDADTEYDIEFDG